MDAHAPWLLDVHWRLFGRCWAQGCPALGRRALFHSQAQLDRCMNTPLAIVLTEQGRARLDLAESEPVVPVVPVSQAKPGLMGKVQ